MGAISSIEWTEATWNPVTGCSKVSEGCRHCYAERLARRLCAMGNPRYAHGFELCLHEDLLDLPLKWGRPKMVFVNSMSDLFHEDVPLPFIRGVFDTMVQADWHTFQVLTKRARRLAEVAPVLPWPPNLWMGVTVERQDSADRLDALREVPAAVRFVSCEPLLGPVKLNLRGIQWLIVGGESGPGARPMQLTWVRSLREQCATQGTRFFLKQLGGVVDKRGRNKALLDGQVYRQMPRAAYL